MNLKAHWVSLTQGSPQQYDVIDHPPRLDQRVVAAISILFYLYLCPSRLIMLEHHMLLLSGGMLYIASLFILKWLHYNFKHRQSSISRWFIYSDTLFASFCYFLDVEPISLGFLYLFILTLNNSCRYSEYLYKFSVIIASIAFFFTSLLHFSIQGTLPNIAWFIQILFYCSALAGVSLLYRQLRELESHDLKQREIDSITGMLHLDSFSHAVRLGLELRKKDPFLNQIMVIDISEQTHTTNYATPAQMKIAALKYMARLLHINLKPDDLGCRAEEYLFAILLFNCSKKEASELGIALQHEFALWTDHQENHLFAAISLTQVPIFAVPIDYLIQHTKQGLVEAIARRGLPGVIHCPEIKSLDFTKAQRVAR